MSADLKERLERLRDTLSCATDRGCHCDTLTEAAAELERLGEALERIANWKYPKVWDGESDIRADATEDFQAIARAALADLRKDKDGD